MKKLFISLGLIFILLLLFNCDNQATQPADGPEEYPVRDLNALEKQVVQADNQFGLKLFRQINAAENDKNSFISPLSISMALGMTWNGAGGATRDSMQAVLELAGLTPAQVNESYQSLIALLLNLDPNVQMEIANSIWYRNSLNFEPNFIQLNQTYFNAQVTGLDFTANNAASIINQWVSEHTHARIQQIVEAPINPLTIMFLINAIYFKGTWTYQFDPNLTQPAEFSNADGSKSSVQMMNQSTDFHYFSTSQFQAIDLPYGRKKFRMAVVLPNSDVDINQLISQLTAEKWLEWVGSFAKQPGSLALPKFTFEYEIELKKALSALGMGIAFSDVADFTNMYAGGGIYINKVKHKSFVEVNEEGTKAAAVTSVEMRFTSVGGNFQMLVDRPFMFIIYENHSQTILFIGKITNLG